MSSPIPERNTLILKGLWNRVSKSGGGTPKLPRPSQPMARTGHPALDRPDEIHVTQKSSPEHGVPSSACGTPLPASGISGMTVGQSWRVAGTKFCKIFLGRGSSRWHDAPKPLPTRVIDEPAEVSPLLPQPTGLRFRATADEPSEDLSGGAICALDNARHAPSIFCMEWPSQLS